MLFIVISVLFGFDHVYVKFLVYNCISQMPTPQLLLWECYMTSFKEHFQVEILLVCFYKT